MATDPMFNSVAARWIRTDISARLAAITFLKGGGGNLSAVINCGLVVAASTAVSVFFSADATYSRDEAGTYCCCCCCCC